MIIKHDLRTHVAFIWVVTMDPETGKFTRSEEPIDMKGGTVKELEAFCRAHHKFGPNQCPYFTSAYRKPVLSIEKLMYGELKLTFIAAYRIWHQRHKIGQNANPPKYRPLTEEEKETL